MYYFIIYFYFYFSFLGQAWQHGQAENFRGYEGQPTGGMVPFLFLVLWIRNHFYKGSGSDILEKYRYVAIAFLIRQDQSSFISALQKDVKNTASRVGTVGT